MPTLSFSDSQHTLTCDAALNINHTTTALYEAAVTNLDTASKVATVALSSGTITITLKDSRVFTVAAKPPAPNSKEILFQVTTPDFFTVPEYALLQSLAALISDMAANNGLTTLTDTFA